MAVTNSIKAQIISRTSEDKTKTTTFSGVNPEAADTDVASSLNLYAGLMEHPAEELRIVETRVVTE